jgi:hypothetical protein
MYPITKIKIKIMNNIPQGTTIQNTAKYYFTKRCINNTIPHPIHNKKFMVERT